MPTSRTRRRAVLTAALVASVLALPTAGARAGGGCPGAHSVPGRTSEAALAMATVCLINRERAAHHLRPLRFDNHAGRAASSYASEMKHGHFLSHFSRSGGPSQRLHRAGFRCRHCPIGEDIAWYPYGGSPARVVSLWMHSAGHRFNILYRRYHLIGLGLATLSRRHGGGVYVADFG